MTLVNALLLLLLGSITSIIIFYLLVKFQISIEEEKDEN